MERRILDGHPDEERYTRWLEDHPRNNLWQSLAWKKCRESCGKRVNIWVLQDGHRILCSALIVIDRTIFGFETWDIPRGPIVQDNALSIGNRLMVEIVEEARKQGVTSITFSPHVDCTTEVIRSRASRRHVYPDTTRIIDLTEDEESILGQMHPKGRYNIKVATKHGVTVRNAGADDIDNVYSLLEDTAERDSFRIAQKSTYKRFLATLKDSFILIAEKDQKALAMLIGVIYGKSDARRGIYYYGASSYADRSLMAPYALQWAAMKYCKARGCTSYDLLGEAGPHATENDPWTGITAFKKKFGGKLETYPGEHVVILRPWIARCLELKRALLG